MAHRRAPSRVTVGDEPSMNSQVPSSPSSSLCPERTQKASEAESEWLHWPDDHD
jgi:hypothetical protein